MPLSATVKARDDLQKIAAVEINTTAKAGGAAVQLLVTDGWSLRNASDAPYLSRLLPGYTLEESTGSRAAPSAPQGTGLGGAISPNVLTMRVDNRDIAGGGNLNAWRDYYLPGSELIMLEGAPMDETGATVAFADFEEIFFGEIESARRVDVDGDGAAWEIRAVSHEGWNPTARIVRAVYRGFGFGAELDNSAGAPAAASLTATLGSAFTPTAGKYSFGVILDLVTLPSVNGVDGTLWDIGGKILATLKTSNDKITVTHNATTAELDYAFDTVDLGLVVVIRYDGSSLYLYVDGDRVATAAMATAPTTLTTACWFGRNAGNTTALDCKIWEIWLDNLDIGDDDAEARGVGPLYYDAGDADQQGIVQLWRFRENENTTTESLVQTAPADLTFTGTAAWINSFEGPDVQTENGIAGKTKPFIRGRVWFHRPQPIGNGAGTQTKPLYQAHLAGVGIINARIGGVNAVLAYSDTVTGLPMIAASGAQKSVVDNVDLAKVVQLLVRDDVTGRIGVYVELAANPGSNANDGTWEVQSVEGKRYVELRDLDGGSLVTVTANTDITIPAPNEFSDIDPDTPGNGIFQSERNLSTGSLQIDCDTVGESTPTPEVSADWLRAARDRTASTPLVYSLTSSLNTTWVGATGLQNRDWSLAIQPNADPTYQELWQNLLDSFFMWSSDTGRVGGNPACRMGHWHVPASGGTVFRSDQVVRGSIQEPSALPQSWRLVVRYRKNHNPVTDQNLPGAITPGGRELISSDWTEVEVGCDTSIRDNNPQAREVFWETHISRAYSAILLGRRIWEFLKEDRFWWPFRLDVRREEIDIGEDFTITHDGFGGETHFMLAAKTSIPTRRGIDVVAIS